jgi:hypothetical protein
MYAGRPLLIVGVAELENTHTPTTSSNIYIFFLNFFHIRLHQPLGNSFRYNGKSSQQRLVRSFVMALSSFGLHNILLLSVIKIQYITFMLDSHFISFVTCLYGPW